MNPARSVNMHVKIAYVGNVLSPVLDELSSQFSIQHEMHPDQLKEHLDDQSIFNLPDIIILEADESEKCFTFVEQIKKSSLLRGLIIIILASEKRNDWKLRALELKVHDYYTYPFPVEHLTERLNFLVKFKLIKPRLSELQEQVDVVYKLPFAKRLFDILLSATALIVLSPFLLIIAILIRLDSKGPIIYKSKRVGTGYNIFDFYKFRSMRTDADQLLKGLSSLNQYLESPEDLENDKAVFVKIKGDPRITRFGSFMRNTSIDELPQLFNVLKGDMSLVGNRPLPLYEAEMLTSNEWSLRFNGPAGVTGLWQISKRGQQVISERERKKLDNFYALKYSFWFDVEILFRTIPALFQKEKV